MTLARRMTLLSLLGAVALLSSTSQAESSGHEPFGRLSVKQVAKIVAARSAAIFDNNNRDRYDKGHVPGAVWVSPDAVTARILPTDLSKTLVFYCANTRCSACHEGARAAVALGHTRVFIMPAGIAGWEKAGERTEKGT